jgi:hypothetical protein
MELALLRQCGSSALLDGFPAEVADVAARLSSLNHILK